MNFLYVVKNKAGCFVPKYQSGIAQFRRFFGSEPVVATAEILAAAKNVAKASNYTIAVHKHEA